MALGSDNVFKFVSSRPLQLPSPEARGQAVIRDPRVQSPDGIEKLLDFARGLDSPAAALRRWQELELDRLAPLAAGQRALVERYRKADAESPPAGADLLKGLKLTKIPAGAGEEAWDALYTAHATGPDAGPRLEVPTAALRLLHYVAALDGESSPDVATAVAYLSAQPAISPRLDAVLRPPGKPPAAPAPPPSPPGADSAGARQAKELSSELGDARGLLGALSAPLTASPAKLEATAPEPVETFSEQRLAANTAPALHLALGPELSSSQASLLDKLGVTPGTPVTQATRMLQGHVAMLSDRALSLAGNPEFEAGLASISDAPRIWELLPLDPAAPSTAADVDVHGRIKPLGIGDLKVVKQDLLAYEPGEVAYIENVLKGETKSRVYRTLDRTETTVMVGEEEVHDTERDTQATERFELKREADQTIKEDLSVKAGLSVTASYGPIVATATGDFAYSTAKEQSEKSSGDFAREVVDKSVTKIQTKVTTQRTTNTINEVEETDTHALDNKGGAENVAGIYRWVDKRYKAQVYNYGVRMLLEFVVPEPAAFYRAAHSTASVKVDATPPADFINDLTAVQPKAAARRLAARDIEETNYDLYAARYGATGVSPPPPSYQSVGVTLSDDNLDDGKSIAMTSKDLVVPAGYTLYTYQFAASVLWINHPKFTVQIGGDLYKLTNDISGGNSFLLAEQAGSTSASVDGSVPLSVAAYDVHAFSLNVEAVCKCNPETFTAWQLATYDKIEAAYQALAAAYEQKVTQAQAQSGAIQGHNPGLNRAVIETELKKLCVTMMTGQHFSQFHAVTDPGDPPEHIPEVEVEEALREGPIVQFFEQAFEWEQMTYLFYPYFWGRKSKWAATTTTVEDPDPSFEEFLTAGSCRVLVPVPLAYVESVQYMLQSPATDLAQKVWNGGEPPTLESDLYESLADEVRNQTDDLAGATPEGEPWEFTLPTTLVWLQPDSTLPVFS